MERFYFATEHYKLLFINDYLAQLKIEEQPACSAVSVNEWMNALK